MGLRAFSVLVALVALLPRGAAALCLAPPGDVNGTGLTNISDVQCALVTVLWSLSPVGDPPGCTFGVPAKADADCSGEITVTDVTIIITNAFLAPLAPSIDANGDGCADACDGAALPGDCCAEGEAAGCEDAACSGCVCALDDLCCDVVWDSWCVFLATEDCTGACACGALACSDLLACAGGCGDDAGCVDGCLGAVVPAQASQAAALWTCAEGNGCAALSGASLEACVAASCAGPAWLCEAAGLGDCCAANGSPSCGSILCPQCVCDIDPLCCDVEWDGPCAALADNGSACNYACQCSPNSCIDIVQCSLECAGDSICGDLCRQNASAGSSNAAAAVWECLLEHGCAALSDAELANCAADHCAAELGVCNAN